MRCRISCHLAPAPISLLTPSYLPALTVLVRCSERLASRCGPSSPGWSCKNSLALALPRIYPQTPMILCSGRPRMSSENGSPGATAAGAPGPCSWCLFHFLSRNTFPLVFTETICLDGMRFCYWNRGDSITWSPVWWLNMAAGGVIMGRTPQWWQLFQVMMNLNHWSLGSTLPSFIQLVSKSLISYHWFMDGWHKIIQYLLELSLWSREIVTFVSSLTMSTFTPVSQQ